MFVNEFFIKSADFPQDEKTIVVDLSQLSSGSYTVVLSVGDQLIEQKTVQVIR